MKSRITALLITFLALAFLSGSVYAASCCDPGASSVAPKVSSKSKAQKTYRVLAYSNSSQKPRAGCCQAAAPIQRTAFRKAAPAKACCGAAGAQSSCCGFGSLW